MHQYSSSSQLQIWSQLHKARLCFLTPYLYECCLEVTGQKEDIQRQTSSSSKQFQKAKGERIILIIFDSNLF
jgi:hypothetical protein